jgi:ABC-type nitrate/sulfonate/bicarbonate transport system substrate-binding protein
MLRVMLLAATLALGLLSSAAEAQAPKALEVISFPGGFNWPLWAAQDQGFFAKNGIEIHLTPTPGSVFLMTNLIDGKFDIGVFGFDNLVAYDEGQGEAPTKEKADLFAFMGGDNGFLHLVTLPEIKSFQDLKGKELSVDARTTGYAFVLEKLLEKGGLGPNDYSLVKAGGALERFEAMMEKKHAGTLMLSPFDVAATAKGYNDLATAVDVLGRYQGAVGATRRQWAAEHQAELVGYIKAYLAGLDWLYDPANKPAAIALLRKNLPKMAPELADRTYAVLLDPARGFARKGEIDVEGIKTVLALRSEYGEPKKALTEPARYYDLTYYAQAVK